MIIAGWIALGVSLIVLIGAFMWHERALGAPAAADPKQPKVRPLRFQFVPSDDELVDRLEALGDSGRKRLRSALAIDTLIIVGFTATFTCLSLLAIPLMRAATDRGFEEQAVGICMLMIGAIFVAAVMDLSENALLAQAIDVVDTGVDAETKVDRVRGTAGQIRIAAGLKWGIIALQLLWILVLLTIGTTHSPEVGWTFVLVLVGVLAVLVAVAAARRAWNNRRPVSDSVSNPVSPPASPPVSPPVSDTLQV